MKQCEKCQGWVSDMGDMHGISFMNRKSCTCSDLIKEADLWISEGLMCGGLGSQEGQLIQKLAARVTELEGDLDKAIIAHYKMGGMLPN